MMSKGMIGLQLIIVIEEGSHILPPQPLPSRPWFPNDEETEIVEMVCSVNLLSKTSNNPRYKSKGYITTIDEGPSDGTEYR